MSTLRVLVVDDSAVNRLVLARVIEGLGHEVALAADGEEAVAAVAAGRFDVVVIDLHMPVLGGLDAARRIRRLESPPACHIIGMSASDDAGGREICFQAGMDDYLVKSAVYDDLAERLSALAGGAEQA